MWAIGQYTTRNQMAMNAHQTLKPHALGDRRRGSARA
jgi:hypothetical protein